MPVITLLDGSPWLGLGARGIVPRDRAGSFRVSVGEDMVCGYGRTGLGPTGRVRISGKAGSVYPNRRHPAVLDGMTRIRTAKCLALSAPALAAAACAACGGEAARRPASVFEDPGTARWTLAPSPRLAIGGDDGRSTLLETVAGGDLVVGSTDTLRLERIAPDGSVRHRTTLPWTPTPVRAEWVESERKRLFQQEKDRFERLFVRLAGLDPARAAADLATLEEQYRTLPHRRTLPAFAALRSDPLGHVWVAAPTVPGSADTITWAVLDSLFRPLATVRVPAPLEVLGLGAAHLLGASRDTLGRITIGLYPVIRPARRPETGGR